MTNTRKEQFYCNGLNKFPPANNYFREGLPSECISVCEPHFESIETCAKQSKFVTLIGSYRSGTSTTSKYYANRLFNNYEGAIDSLAIYMDGENYCGSHYKITDYERDRDSTLLIIMTYIFKCLLTNINKLYPDIKNDTGFKTISILLDGCNFNKKNYKDIFNALITYLNEWLTKNNITHLSRVDIVCDHFDHYDTLYTGYPLQILASLPNTTIILPYSTPNVRTTLNYINTGNLDEKEVVYIKYNTDVESIKAIIDTKAKGYLAEPSHKNSPFDVNKLSYETYDYLIKETYGDINWMLQAMGKFVEYFVDRNLDLNNQDFVISALGACISDCINYQIYNDEDTRILKLKDKVINY